MRGEDDADIFLASGALAPRRLGRGKQRSVGVFGEVSIVPHPKLEILGSLRGDFYRNFDGRIIEDGVVRRFVDKDITEFTCRGALRYQLVPAVALRGAVPKYVCRIPQSGVLFSRPFTRVIRARRMPNL